MFFRCTVFTIIIYVSIACFNCQEVDENFNQLIHDTDWPCVTGCFEAGGQAKFEPRHGVCKCYMDEHVDETDLLPLQKLGKILETEVITSPDDPQNTNVRARRDINKLALEDPKKKLFFKKLHNGQPTIKKPVKKILNPKKVISVNTIKPIKIKTLPKANAQNVRLREIENKIEGLRAKFIKSTPHLQSRNGDSNEDDNLKSSINEIKEKHKALQLKLKNRYDSLNEPKKLGSPHSVIESPLLKNNKFLKSRINKDKVKSVESSEEETQGLIVSPMKDDPIVGKSLIEKSPTDEENKEKNDSLIVGLAAKPLNTIQQENVQHVSTIATSSTTSTTSTPIESSPTTSTTKPTSKIKQKFDETKSKLQNLIAAPVASIAESKIKSKDSSSSIKQKLDETKLKFQNLAATADAESKTKNKDSSVSLVIQQIKEKQKETADKIRQKVLPQKSTKSETGELGAEKISDDAGTEDKKDN